MKPTRKHGRWIMTIQDVVTKYPGLQIVPCSVKSEAGETKMYMFIFVPNAEHTPDAVKQIIDNAISDFVGHNSYHVYVPADLNNNCIKIIFVDISALIPARPIATITVTSM